MTMTFSSSLSNQLDFELTLAALAATAAGRSRSTRPNRTVKRRPALDDHQTSYSIMKRENLLAIMQAPTISKLIGKYTAASETSPRAPPLGGGGGRRDSTELEEREVEEEDEDDEEEEEIFHDATDVDELTSSAPPAPVTTAPPAPSTAAQTPTAAANGPIASGQWQLECKYTLSEVQQHNCLDDCWMVIFDKVYNITDFVHEHPGGDFILFEYAGRDATHPFLSSRHGSSAYKMLDKYWIGILVDEELYYSNNSSYCSVYLDLSWRSTPTLEEATGAAGSG